MIIGFWTKDTGNLMSHGSGLTPEQIADFQKLKIGDRLILWLNDKAHEKSPSYTLKVYKKRENPVVEGKDLVQQDSKVLA